MSQIIIRGAQLRYFDGRVDEAGAFKRLHFRADLTREVCEDLGVEIPPDCIPSGKLATELIADHISFEPNGNLNSLGWQIGVEKIGEFSFGTTKSKEDAETEETYLAFVALSRQKDAAAILENFHNSVGTGRGVLNVRYAEQGELTEATDATTEQSEDEPGALAPAAVAAGSTDQLRKERKKRQKPKAEPGDGPVCIVDGESSALREHEWTHERGRATVRIVDQDGLKALTDLAVDGIETESWETLIEEGPVSIPRIGVAAFGQIEHWCRQTAAANGITAERKSALAQLLTWARSQAGEYRQAGRVEAEAVHG